jgi:hypothetical protein
MIKTDALVEIFCDIDDFCKQFEPECRKKLKNKLISLDKPSFREKAGAFLDYLS